MGEFVVDGKKFANAQKNIVDAFSSFNSISSVIEECYSTPIEYEFNDNIGQILDTLSPLQKEIEGISNIIFNALSSLATLPGFIDDYNEVMQSFGPEFNQSLMLAQLASQEESIMIMYEQLEKKKNSTGLTKEEEELFEELKVNISIIEMQKELARCKTKEEENAVYEKYSDSINKYTEIQNKHEIDELNRLTVKESTTGLTEEEKAYKKQLQDTISLRELMTDLGNVNKDNVDSTLSKYESLINGLKNKDNLTMQEQKALSEYNKLKIYGYDSVEQKVSQIDSRIKELEKKDSLNDVEKEELRYLNAEKRRIQDSESLRQLSRESYYGVDYSEAEGDLYEIEHINEMKQSTSSDYNRIREDLESQKKVTDLYDVDRYGSFGEAYKARMEYEGYSTARKIWENTKVGVASFANGVGNVAEILVDGVVMLGSGAVLYATPVGTAIQATGYVQENILGMDKKDTITSQYKEGVSDFVSAKWADSAYDKLVDAGLLNDYVAYGDVHNITKGGTEFAGYTALTFVPGGAAVTGTVGALAAAGSTAQRAFDSGATYDEALISSAVSAGAGYASGAALNKVQAAAESASTIGQVVGYVAAGAGIAASEPVVNSVAEYYTYGKNMVDENGNKIYDSYWDYFNETGGVTSVAMAAGVGGLSTGISAFKGFRSNSKNAIEELAETGVVVSSADVSIKSPGDDMDINSNKVFSEVSNNADTYYGSDQNISRKYLKPKVRDISWLDENEAGYISFMVNKFPEVSEERFANYINRLRSGSEMSLVELEDMKEFIYSLNNYDVEKSVDVISSVIERNEGAEYKRLRDILMDKGLSYKDSTKILDNFDNLGGNCTYAAGANSIFDMFIGKETKFKEIFGFDMYTIIDGQRRLNSNELILDMYTFINSNDYVDKYEDVSRIFKNTGGKLEIDDINRTRIRANSDQIKQYINYKDSNLDFSTKEYMFHFDPDKQDVIDNLKTYVKDNDTCRLSLYSYDPLTDKNLPPVNFYDEYGNVYVSTANWNEGGSHIVFITDIDDEYITVSSWGRKLKIKHEELADNLINIQIDSLGGI